jgi:hypothetical protein
MVHGAEYGNEDIPLPKASEAEVEIGLRIAETEIVVSSTAVARKVSESEKKGKRTCDMAVQLLVVQYG